MDMMISLRLFGAASVMDEGGALTGPPSHQHRLALLALLATSPSRALTRDKLIALLWPHREARAARKLLNQSVYVLRKALGEDAVLTSGEELRLGLRQIDCDVVTFEEALARGEPGRAVKFYAGPFLDGFFLDRAPEFGRWVDRERRRLAAAYARALEELAGEAEDRGDLRAAAEWWKARARHDPYDSAVALRLMEALVSADNPAGALRLAEAHEHLLREELAIDPPPAVLELAEKLRRRGTVRTGREAEGDRSARAVPPDAHSSNTGAETVSTQLALPEPRARAPEESRHSVYRYVTAILVLVAASAVAVRLGFGSGDEAVRLAEDGTSSVPAWELYQQGTDPELLRSDAGARQGLGYLREAVALDPTFAAAWASLACLALRVSGDGEGDMSREELQALAEEAAVEAVVLDDSLAEAQAAMGLVRMARFDFDAAERHLKRAIELRPDYSRAREWLIAVYLWTGRQAAAVDEARALNVESLSASARAEVARTLAASGRCEEALARLQELKALRTPLLRAGSIAASCHARNGSWRDAIDALGVGPHSNAYSLALRGHMLGRAGGPIEIREAQDILGDLLARRHDTGELPVAILHAGLGDVDDAFASMERAIRDGSLIGSAMHFQILTVLQESLGDDSRFEALRQRLRLELD